MTRSKLYYYCRNNGVTGLANADVVREREQRSLILDALLKGIKGTTAAVSVAEIVSKNIRLAAHPIFTFVKQERYDESPWFTGNMDDFDSLCDYITRQGGRVQKSSFFVPFSNGMETRWQDPEQQSRELRYVTTIEDFHKEFGITPEEIAK